MTTKPETAEEFVKRVSEYEAEATPGPWTLEHDGQVCAAPETLEYEEPVAVALVDSWCGEPPRERAKANRLFVANARTDLQRALAHIETLMAERILNLKAIHEFKEQCEQANGTIAELQKRVDQGIANLQEANREIERLRAERNGAIEELRHLGEDDLDNLSNYWANRIRRRLNAREGA